jgi:dTDP-4-dehydrorhamnose reductase
VGVFDTRSGTPRPTALTSVLKDLSAGRAPQAIGLEQPGWWRRSSRFADAPPPRRGEYDQGDQAGHDRNAAPLLIVGTDGALVRLVERACEVRALNHLRLRDVGEEALRALRPWAVVDARDWAGVCEEPVLPAPMSAWEGALPAGSSFMPPEKLAALCGRLGVPLAVFSAASGFEEVEERLLEAAAGHLLLAKTDRVFTPWDRSRFAVRVLDALDAGLPVEVDAVRRWDGAYGPDVVDVALDLLMDRLTGPVSLVSPEPWSVAEFVRRMADTADADPGLIMERSGTQVEADPGPELTFLPPGETTIERFVRECRCGRSTADEAVTRRQDEPHQAASAEM